MIQEEIKVRVLIPSEGYKLTQAKEVEIRDRIISDKVYLAVSDSPDNWVEISEETAAVIRTQQEELVNKEN